MGASPLPTEVPAGNDGGRRKCCKVGLRQEPVQELKPRSGLGRVEFMVLVSFIPALTATVRNFRVFERTLRIVGGETFVVAQVFEGGLTVGADGPDRSAGRNTASRHEALRMSRIRGPAGERATNKALELGPPSDCSTEIERFQERPAL